MSIEKVTEPFKHQGIEALRLRHEIRPEAEGTRDVATMLGEHLQLVAHYRRVIATPHSRAANTRPEISPNPRTPLAKLRHRFSQLLMPARIPPVLDRGHAQRHAVNPSLTK